MEQASAKTEYVGTRVTPQMAERLRRAGARAGVEVYAPNVSQIITRGIELALQELERKRSAK